MLKGRGIYLFLLIGQMMIFCAFSAGAQEGVDLPTNLEADDFIYDAQSEHVSAIGNVVLEQDGQTLTADKIRYDLKTDQAVASGNVLFIDDRGNENYADQLELNDRMRQGVVDNLFTVLEDGSRMFANKAIRDSPSKHVLNDARYTSCKACEDDPDATPPWGLRASKVTHDKENATVEYDNARFLAWGVPIFYTPYFSHPDGTVDQKSGFLTPEFGFGSDYGFNTMMPYYWAIDPSFDATIGARVFTRSAPQLNLEMRKRYEDAYVRAAATTTYSDRTDRSNGVDIYRDDEMRGHFELESLWNIDRHWRAGTEIKLASDEQYLDQYDIDYQDVLTNRIYVEGFDDRDYTTAQLLAFQDLRLDVDVDQPNALPFMQVQKIGDPNALLGGRWQWDASYLNLYREGSDQDMNRLSSRLGWQRRDVLPLGLVSTVETAVRSDAYYTSDRDIAKTDPTEDNSKMDTRAIPTANLEVGLPLVKPLSRGQVRVKPKIGITVRPDVDNDSDIPNEDSIDSQINVTNLFDIDRFPGLDRVEDRSHVNYMVETGYYDENGDEITLALGQSYRLDDKDNPFQNGSGFEQQESDIVGQIGASFDNNRHNLNYRFQLDGRGMDVERHEIYGATTIEKVNVSAIYLYEKGSPGTEFVDSREQVLASVSRPIDEKWSVGASALYDLGVDKGLRKSQLAINYDDECYGVTTELQRDLQSDASGANDTSLIVRLRLKNLGEFETTAYDFGTDENDDLGDDLNE